jgi:trehalose-phosphatase
LLSSRTVQIPYDTSEAVAEEISRRLGDRHVLVLTDFDGTLAELAPTPDEAVISEAVRVQFAELAALETVTTGIVSGRRLTDVRDRVGAGTEFVAGLHGLEIVGPHEMYAHESLAAVAPVIRDLRVRATRELAWCHGLMLEDKTFALTCHVRLAASEDADRALELFAGLARRQIDARVLRLMTGAKAAEVLPAADWHKGRAVDWIRSVVSTRLRMPVPVIYLGDDRTDEDAFGSLGPDDLAIGVGPRPQPHLIHWRLAGPASVGRLFARLRVVQHA